MLNKANKVLGYSKISSGGISGTLVDPKLIFQTALKANASSIILAHNHPSGNKQPSDADTRITKKCTGAGTLLDITVLDHLIITPDDLYYSYADEGTL
jgi:DNA repair protein RadC